MQDRKGADPGGSSENLPLLYQGLLTGIVRLKGQRQRLPDSESFRRRTKATLQEIERVAVAGGYDSRDVWDTHFAVVAFLDEAILHSNDPVRAEWEQRILQQDLFGQTDAGVVFFEKLEQLRSRRDSEQLADILEVYLLCLLLGFEGRYAGARRGELEGLTETVRMRIEYIRGRSDQISPSANSPRAAAPPAPAKGPASQFHLITLGLIAFTLILFWILRTDLVSRGEDLFSRLP
ncbi:MAG TPA: DotU family type IV/VI secretion system protein [Bryobacteraceae bacterium]|jgi:type VI secretion system protein ImpK